MALLGALSLTPVVSLVQDSVALPDQEVYGPGLFEMGRWTGQYAFSADGFGAAGEQTSSGNLVVEKPTGATTVEAAFLAMPSKYNTDPNDPTATLNGTAVTFTHRTGGANEDSWQNVLADVTDLVSTTLNSATAGGADTNIPVVYDSSTGNGGGPGDGGGYTGVALTVIWNSTTADAGTTIFQFGHAAPAGETTTITFDALPATPTGSRLSLGIGWSLNDATEVTYVDITTSQSPKTQLTRYAGAYDDGTSNLDALITVGGVGDNAKEPDDLNSRSDDEELYNLDSFFQAGDTSLTIDTRNPSNNDTVFQLLLYVPGVLATETVTFDANGGSGTMADQTASSATNLSSNSFSRSGYSFTGWNTSADGTGTDYAENASYPFTASDTLYAQWVVAPPTTQASTTQSSCGSGIFLTVTGQISDSLLSSPVIYGSCALTPGAPYLLTVEALRGSAASKRMLGSGAIPQSGAFERTTYLPIIAGGNYKVVLTSTHPLGHTLTLTNRISVNPDRTYSSISPESLQPHLR